VRRIERRKALQQIEKIEDYVMFLQKTPQEVEALFRDILIGVTNFFRDPQAFDALDAQIGSRLLADKQPDAKVRIWLPACSSGDEAYSVAILLQERMRNLKRSFAVQIFATDIDSRAIVKARAGLYPQSIAADVTLERLEGFFTLEPGGGYRVRKFIRDMITFSEHDVIKDPPFSQLDLISCRNLLIYLRAELQVKLLRLFHYALNPGGILFLGSAEGVGENDGLFSVLDGKFRLFLRSDRVPPRASGNFMPPLIEEDLTLAPRTDKPSALAKRTLGEETEQALLQLLAPACALVEGNGDILHLRGRTGMYLEPAPGDVGVVNILRMAREGLAQDLRISLHQAVQSREVVRRSGLRVRTNGHFTRVNLTVSPVLPGTVDVQPSNRYLVVLEEAPLAEAEAALESPATEAAEPNAPINARVAALELELRAKEKLLRSALESADISTEELRSAVEEMQSVNEELQASNEELATSKEELQSVNEELATVNVEQQNKMVDLARALNDNRNLLAGSGIATVFVDLQQRILSFTPGTTAIIKLVATDVGRPLGHFVTSLRDYDALTEDIAAVLETLATKETKVQDKAGRWYMLRILPYRTTENMIEGAVITFIDITEVTKAQVDITQLQEALAKLKESEQRFRAVVSALSEGVVLQGPDGSINTWNPATERILGLSGEQLQGLRAFGADWQTIHEDGTPFPLETHPGSQVLKTGVPQHDVTMGLQRPGKPMVWISVTALPIRDPNDAAQASVVVSFTDITERKRLQDALNLAAEDRRLATVVRDANDAITLQSMEGRILAWNPAAQRMYGWTEAEAQQMTLMDRLPPGQGADTMDQLKQLGQAKVLEPYRSQRLTKQGTTVKVSITATALRNEAGAVYAVSTTERLIQSDQDE
jgi:two-component system CheB/CheR fusion protein